MTRYVSCHLFLLLLVSSLAAAFDHYGIYQGNLSTFQHEVKGNVYIANNNTFIVRNFHYDGSGPDAFFWVSETAVPNVNGAIAPHTFPVKKLGAYFDQEIIVKLPDGFEMSDVRSLSVWCRQFAVDFGNVRIDGSNIPQPQNVGTFPPGSAHGVSASGIVIVDTKTIKIETFKYDGQAPDVYFIVGRGAVSSQGTKVPVEGQALKPLPRYSGQDVILKLPGDMTVFDITYISVYCVAYSLNFGNIVMPNPSSLVNIPVFIPNNDGLPDTENLPCKTIKSKKMNVYWKKNGDDLQITLKGIVEELEYLAFGISGSSKSAKMVGGDVAIAYARKGKVVLGDYYLNQKSACFGVKGVCLDENQGGKDNLRRGSSQYIDGILTATYHRSFLADESKDKPFNSNGVTSVIAASGDVDSRGEIKFHSYYSKDTILIDFSDESSSCEPLTNDVAEKKYEAWAPSTIFNNTDLFVKLGPAGGEKGYKGITGSESWGIAFYVNGLLIPEVTVVRGVTYKFTIEAGNDKQLNHPLYITTNSQGGQGSPGNKDKSGIVAGVTKDGNGNYIPTAGRLCEFKAISGQEDAWKTANSFAEYKKSLKLNCQAGQSATFLWTPDDTTPDLVYYQCWIHRNLGWKVHVTNSNVNLFSNFYINV